MLCLFKNLITPWREIFTSMPVWAVTISHAGHNCGFWLLLSEMPSFINSVLKFDIKSVRTIRFCNLSVKIFLIKNIFQDGLVSSLPYLAMWLCQFPVTYLADYMNKKNVTSLTVSRKFWNTLGNIDMKLLHKLYFAAVIVKYTYFGIIQNLSKYNYYEVLHEHY